MNPRHCPSHVTSSKGCYSTNFRGWWLSNSKVNQCTHHNNIHRSHGPGKVKIKASHAPAEETTHRVPCPPFKWSQFILSSTNQSASTKHSRRVKSPNSYRILLSRSNIIFQEALNAITNKVFYEDSSAQRIMNSISIHQGKPNKPRTHM